MDGLLGLTLGLLGLFIWWTLFRRTDDALHPLGVFAASWLGVFGFAHFNVPKTFDEPYYAEPFALVTYLVVFGALASFAIGFWLVDPATKRVDRVGLSERLTRGVSARRLGSLTVGLFAAASLMTAYFVMRAGAIPLFSPRIDELRTTFKLPLLGYVYDLHYAVALFATMLFVRTRSRTQKVFWAGVAGLSVFQLMFAGVRVSPMTALTWIVIFLFYRPGGVKLRHLVAVAVVMVALFSVIETYRRTMYTVNPALVNPRLDLSWQATAWAHTAASFKNLQYTLLHQVSPLHMGLTSYDLPKTLDPAARAVDAEISYIYGTHNTPTFLSFLYFDFGLGGLLVMPGFYGALVAYVYRRFRERANLFWLLVYIDFLLAVVLAFRTHRFLGNGLIWFTGVAVLAQLVAGVRLDDEDAAVEAGEPPPTRAVTPSPAAG